MVQKDIFWIIGEYSHFGLFSSYILFKDKSLWVEEMDMCNISLTV